MSPIYIMLVGLPASGKSTLVQEIINTLPKMDWHVVSTDDYIDAHAEKIGSTYNAVFDDMIDAATKSMNEGRQSAINARRNIIHDQTNLTAKSRAKKFASVPSCYVRVGIICAVPEMIRTSRLASRPGKTIPADINARMIADYQPISTGEFSVVTTANNWLEAIKPLI